MAGGARGGLHRSLGGGGGGGVGDVAFCGKLSILGLTLVVWMVLLFLFSQEKIPISEVFYLQLAAFTFVYCVWLAWQAVEHWRGW